MFEGGRLVIGLAALVLLVGGLALKDFIVVALPAAHRETVYCYFAWTASLPYWFGGRLE